MATFKVGQRVRRIAGCSRAAYDMAPPGQEGVIVKPRTVLGQTLYDVRFSQGVWNCVPESLVPILDDNAETRFLQAMRDYANKQRTPVDVLRELHGEYL
jgi:hypothetical protein